ncbi:MAG: adenylate/guanylate cyclase domain-containing protein [Acidimicrobiales bacterium]
MNNANEHGLDPSVSVGKPAGDGQNGHFLGGTGNNKTGTAPVGFAAQSEDNPAVDASENLYGRDDSARERITNFLLEHGATEDDISNSLNGGMLDLLVADKLLLPGGSRYTLGELCVHAAVDPALVKRLWRALGFPDTHDDERVFTALDVEAVNMFQAMMDDGVIDQNEAIGMARVIGSSMARIADAEVSPSLPTNRFYRNSEDHIAEADRIAGLAAVWMPVMGRMLEYVWRRHIQAAVRRAMLLRVNTGEGSLPAISVGFADMVGFTMLSEQLTEGELSLLISRFEEVSHDVVTSSGGRVVKMIGDEVMFVSDEPMISAGIGVTLAEAYSDDDMLTDVRVAISYGPVLIQDGDYFGPVVNLASRSVEVTSPGMVTVSGELARVLAGLPEFNASDLVLRQLRPRNLKGIGRTPLWSLSRHGAETPTLERWIAMRFEKLAEVGRNLDELRERGEQLIARGYRASTADADPDDRELGSAGSGIVEPDSDDAKRPQIESPIEGG